MFCVQKESQKADEYLREIKEQNLLAEAVKQCVEAAGHEYEHETQKTLLRVSVRYITLREELTANTASCFNSVSPGRFVREVFPEQLSSGAFRQHVSGPAGVERGSGLHRRHAAHPHSG